MASVWLAKVVTLLQSHNIRKKNVVFVEYKSHALGVRKTVKVARNGFVQ